jgi:hypothetical protein
MAKGPDLSRTTAALICMSLLRAHCENSAWRRQFIRLH